MAIGTTSESTYKILVRDFVLLSSLPLLNI